MKYSLLISGFIATLIISSCIGRQNREFGERYNTVVYYQDNLIYSDNESAKLRTNELIHQDTLYLIFESVFDADTVDIQINDIRAKKVSLTTNRVVGIAEVAMFGGMRSIEKVEIVKNRGKSLIIDLPDESMNIWRIRFYSDTLEARRAKFLPLYD